MILPLGSHFKDHVHILPGKEIYFLQLLKQPHTSALGPEVSPDKAFPIGNFSAALGIPYTGHRSLSL
ncbi:hypothetical protein Y1Q_0022591 [Alligator mississippiensis]|uniref:Uncharacterized protein n=1 Tax=Alligator mississippiensis TaxID=8496 RepID=A0A151NQA5_ALLMI|nr:hypothetical protein Y1Q_0022591 [Alligator mississippiensis]